MKKYNNPRIEKIYPIEGRKDFFKFAVMEGDGIAKDMQGDEMVFMDFKEAQTIANASRRVNNKNR